MFPNLSIVQARGRRIRRRRKELGYGLRTFAALAYISPSHLSRIERQISKPSPEVLKRIADALQEPITHIARHESGGTQ